MERRQTPRSQVDITAACRVPATPLETIISDISAAGGAATMETSSFVKRGSTILLQLGQEHSVTGQIIWKSGNRFGVKFHEPLDDATLANIQRANGALT